VYQGESHVLWTGRRYFDISAAREDLGYRPIIRFEDGWKDVVAAQCAKRGVYSGGSWAVFEQKQKKS
jgi:nucleoside-diphosphate-sugar epimerase